LAEWALDRDGRGKEASVKIAEIAGCPVEPYQDLLTCVQNVDAKVLTQAYLAYAVSSSLRAQITDTLKTIFWFY
jgi:hypothetical protein